MNYPKQLKNTLFSIIDEMEKTSFQYVRNPMIDFVRNRKLSFGLMIKIVLTLAGDNLRNEILSYFGFKEQTASTSAFCQQRAKIKALAFQNVFLKFNSSFTNPQNYKGYALLACDGSTVRIPLDKDDPRYSSQGGRDNYDGKYIHLNALYDICNRRYVDAIVEPEHVHKEKAAFIRMVHNNHEKQKTIYIADRGYESYNVMAHIHSQSQYYLIRIKDNHTGGFSKEYPHPDSEEYDETHTRIFTRKRAKEYMDKRTYTYIRHKYEQDFFTSEHELYQMNFRIIRIKVSEEKYTCLVTNLPSTEFNADEIKKLYKMRWGIETSFRELKYAIGLNYFHSKKEELIMQEVYARLITYNFCQSIALHVELKQKQRKHKYKINSTMAIKICRNFLKYDKAPSDDVEKLLEKELLPIRPGRSFDRGRSKRCPVSFSYRV